MMKKIILYESDSTKTEHKQALKLYNQICTYLFEQEYGDLRYNEKLKKQLQETAKELKNIIKL